MEVGNVKVWAEKFSPKGSCGHLFKSPHYIYSHFTRDLVEILIFTHLHPNFTSDGDVFHTVCSTEDFIALILMPPFYIIILSPFLVKELCPVPFFVCLRPSVCGVDNFIGKYLFPRGDTDGIVTFDPYGFRGNSDGDCKSLMHGFSYGTFSSKAMLKLFWNNQFCKGILEVGCGCCSKISSRLAIKVVLEIWLARLPTKCNRTPCSSTVWFEYLLRCSTVILDSVNWLLNWLSRLYALATTMFAQLFKQHTGSRSMIKSSWPIIHVTIHPLFLRRE